MGVDNWCCHQLWPSMVHYEWVTIDAPPPSETWFCFELEKWGGAFTLTTDCYSV